MTLYGRSQAARLQAARGADFADEGSDDSSEPSAYYVPAAPALTGHKRPRPARCGVCRGCNSGDCGSCKNCLDKPKFGGPGCRKQACMARMCSMPLVDEARYDDDDDEGMEGSYGEHETESDEARDERRAAPEPPMTSSRSPQAEPPMTPLLAALSTPTARPADFSLPGSALAATTVVGPGGRTISTEV